MAQARRDDDQRGREPPPYEPKYGTTEQAWRVLCDAIFPGARTSAAIGMALEYCRVRNLDIFKRPVHIVPVRSTAQGRMIESVWPGIAELRTTAARTGKYAGIGATVFGPDEEGVFLREYEDEQRNRQTREMRLVFPSYAQISVFKMVDGTRCEFVGPKVIWREIYATVSRFSKMPNDRWQRSPSGQLEKCSEAGALRRAFPEELGSEYAAEEMEGKVIGDGDDNTGYGRGEVPAAQRPRLVAPPPAETVRRAALAHQPAEVVDTRVQAPAEKEAIAASEPIKVQESRQGREPLPKPPPTQPTFDIVEPLDPQKWLDDVYPRMKQAETLELLEEIWTTDVQPYENEMPPPDFFEAKDVYEACKAKF